MTTPDTNQSRRILALERSRDELFEFVIGFAACDRCGQTDCFCGEPKMAPKAYGWDWAIASDDARDVLKRAERAERDTMEGKWV